MFAEISVAVVWEVTVALVLAVPFMFFALMQRDKYIRTRHGIRQEFDDPPGDP